MQSNGEHWGKFIVTHEISCDQTTFWSRFFDKGFIEKLYLEALGYSSFSILEQQETDTEILRKLQAKVHQPGVLMETDGAWLTQLGVTIAGQPFKHVLIHCVLAYSNWE